MILTCMRRVYVVGEIQVNAQAAHVSRVRYAIRQGSRVDYIRNRNVFTRVDKRTINLHTLTVTKDQTIIIRIKPLSYSE